MLTLIDINQLLQSPTKQVHPSCAGYVSALLQPYINIVSILEDAALRSWIQSVYPKRLQLTILPQIEFNNSIEINRLLVISHLIREIGLQTRNCAFNTILPWDIQYNIANCYDLALIFGMTLIMQKLPVTIVINGNYYKQTMNCEMAGGIHSLSQLNIVDIGIYVYGIKIDDFNRFESESFSGLFYTAELSGNNFETINRKYFRSHCFIQGLEMGAKWIGMNPLLFYRNYLPRR